MSNADNNHVNVGINKFPTGELTALEGTPASDQVIILSISQLKGLIKAVTSPLEARIQALEKLQEEDNSRILQHIAEDRQRLTKLEKGSIEEDSPLLDDLYREMIAIGRKQVDFATAARMVKRSKGRIVQLKAAIALDSRFIILPSESHSQKNLIRLKGK